MNTLIDSFEKVLFAALHEVMDKAVEAEAANNAAHEAELKEAA
jgi:hypothetical protein